MNFVQIISFRAEDPEVLKRMTAEWDATHADSEIMGYAGARLLANRHDPGHYLLIAEFAQVDPDVPAADEAAKNNDRPDTLEWGARLRAHALTDPEYADFDELYRTG